jgi:hypothetical protein
LKIDTLIGPQNLKAGIPKLKFYARHSDIRTNAMAPKEEKVDHPFYEELQAQLKEALNAKKLADKALSGVEEQIEKYEGTSPPFH